MEQVLDARAQPVEIAFGGERQVGAALSSADVCLESVVPEPSGKHCCATLDQVKRRQVPGETGLWFRSTLPQMLCSG